MQSTTNFSSPAVRIHQSSPTPPPSSQAQQSMLATSPYVGGGNDFYNGAYLSAVPKTFHSTQYHKRGSSTSSIASAGPPSPASQSTMNPRIATSETYSPLYHPYIDQLQHYSDHTPHSATGVKTAPMSDDLMFQPSGAYGAVDMRKLNSSGADARASFGGPRSVSSVSHDSPSTPHTTYENDYDDARVFNHSGKSGSDDMISQYLQELGFPSVAYQQSLQDVFPDQAFAPNVGNYAQQMQRRVAGHGPNTIQERLQAAQQDHLRQSPSSAPRDRSSPFKQTSKMLPATQAAPRVPQLKTQRTSISPKELMLDEHDVDEPSYALFPEQQNFEHHRRTQSGLSQTHMPSLSLSQESTAGGIPQQYPFANQQPRQESSSSFGDTPDFPAHLLTMESTNEEGPSEPSSQTSTALRPVPRTSNPGPTSAASSSSSSSSPPPRSSSTRWSKPVDTSSDAGTYSCTYHGCSLRFDTPAKLQKHKREGHRQQSPTAAVNAERNSQAGPHRCERINPGTGKPCSSVFSRPYDLTRHEDTIHNARKQKVRCHLCTEEKTFSRNDALTRHMRVVHPDVDWIGKTRKHKGLR